MSTNPNKSLGVLTSGGDSQGMNAAVRAVVRTALDRGVPVYAIDEGYQGMVDGGDRIHSMSWNEVGGIMQLGGTKIGSARCSAFEKREGRLRAARHLLERDIDSLVIIGGDGSLTGASVLRQEWPGLVEELVRQGEISPETARVHPYLGIVGLAGSIDNDMFGTDMTIGADTALHRITEAIDAITSTAASHRRIFVVEVMGRNCGYLALMGGLAGVADWVLIPEKPPMDHWEEVMCTTLQAGRRAGRRDSIVIVAEGACDRHGEPITRAYVEAVLRHRLQEADVRVTILGHVQRGGAPTAFDRYMGTLLGSAAVKEVLAATPEAEPVLIGIRGNRITHSPLEDCVRKTRAVADAIAARDYDRAMKLRGSSFRESFRTFRTLARSLPHLPNPDQRRLCLAVLNADAPSPGMNTAVRVAVRVGVDQGHILLGVRDGFQGLIDDNIQEMDWQSVAGWAPRGGSNLGTKRLVPKEAEYAAIARHLEKHRIEGLLVIGGWSGYRAAYNLWQSRSDFPAFNLPLMCLPASIDNSLPGSELSIGVDTALNGIVQAVDKIKQSAVATHRVFVVEVMGAYCGYLALMSGLATGAERVYLPEEGVTLRDLQADVEQLKAGFAQGKRLGLLIRNELANPTYDTRFMRALFTEEGKGLFEVRQATILGHIYQGGDPTPFDRIQASRLANRSIQFLIEKAGQFQTDAAFIGLEKGQIHIHNLQELDTMTDRDYQRPKEQWWMELQDIAKVLAQSAPGR